LTNNWKSKNLINNIYGKNSNKSVTVNNSMSKFAVVLCSKCKWALGVKTTTKQSTCNRCGAKINIGKAKIYKNCANERELAAAVAAVNKKTARKRKRPEQVLIDEEEAGVLDGQRFTVRDKRPVATKNPVDALREIDSNDGFMIGDAYDALERSGCVNVDVEELIEKLLMEGILTEFLSRRYRFV
jgi:hypothetical protein